MAADGINTYNENPLHAALKSWYAGDGARFEVPVDGYIVDLVQDGVLVEIQTANFSAMRRKIETLIERHPLRLVHPIAAEKWIVRMDAAGETLLGRRKSPKRGVLWQIFEELVTFPQMLRHPNFSLDVVMIQEEEVRRVGIRKRRRRRRRDWAREERRLIDVVGHRLFLTPGDVLSLVPSGLADPFTTADLSRVCGMPRWLAQKMAYCLREMGQIEAVSRQRAGIVYARAS